MHIVIFGAYVGHGDALVCPLCSRPAVVPGPVAAAGHLSAPAGTLLPGAAGEPLGPLPRPGVDPPVRTPQLDSGTT